jgi:hypothetical protein
MNAAPTKFQHVNIGGLVWLTAVINGVRRKIKPIARVGDCIRR